MTDPNTRHVVCPECHTHQLMMPDGRVSGHTKDGEPCPGSEDWPNRATDAAGQRSATNSFASCPAATGEAHPGCTHFPDGAHRCGLARDHYQTDRRPADERTHGCTCGAEWTSLMGSVGKLFSTILAPSAALTARLIREYTDEPKQAS